MPIDSYMIHAPYVDLVERRFGPTQRSNVEDMTRIKLRRKLLGD